MKHETMRLLLKRQGPVCRQEATPQSVGIHSFISTHRPEKVLLGLQA